VKGQYPGLIPVGPVNITVTVGLESDSSTGIIGASMKKQFEAQMSDTTIRAEFRRVISTIIDFYSEEHDDNAINGYGQFTPDGRFILYAVFPTIDSLRLREMVKSGHLEKGREKEQPTYMILSLGWKVLTDVFKKHKENEFRPGAAMLNYLLLSTDESGMLNKGIDTVSEADFVRRLRKSLEMRDLQQ